MNTNNYLDSEILSINEIKNNGDLFHVGGKIYDTLKIKIACFLFVVFIIISSDIFAENVLSKFFSNTYDKYNDNITEKGVVISGVILVVSYILIDFLNEKNII